jgi:hypothetical protein
MIPVAECKNGGLYKINSRNLAFGVYREESKGFVGIREKFGNVYLFEEYHWDTGAPFGTVKPQEFLEVCPLDDLREGWVGLAEKATEYIKVGQEVFLMNQKLFDWLKEKEKQYGS